MSEETRLVVHFGEFTFDSLTRQLLRAGQVVHLSPKAFELLFALIRDTPNAISKGDLQAQVWPKTFVSEANLTVLIGEIRSALGDDPQTQRFIRTVYGFGYAFSGAETQPKALSVDRPLSVTRRTAMRMIVVAASTLLLASSVKQSTFSLTAPPIGTLAVLPFDLISSNEPEEYLGLGMADSLITRLSSLHRIVVRPTSAVRQFANTTTNSVEAGRQLHADAVLEGSIQRSGNRIRVTARAVDVRSGALLWADRFDENYTHIFAVEDSISAKVAEALVQNLSRAERKLLTRRYTDNAEAHELYVKGRYHYYKKTIPGWQKAKSCFEQAIRLDPHYASAYAGLADTYYRLASGAVEPAKAREQARIAALKSVSLDDSLPEAHMSLATSLMTDWDWPAAEREFKHALALRPIDGETYSPYIVYLQSMGRVQESLTAGKQALQLNPASLIMNADLGYQLYMNRRYADAARQLHSTLELDPNFSVAHARLGLVYLKTGQYVDAIDEFRTARAEDNSPQSWGRLAILGYAYGISERRAEAMAVLAELEQLAKDHYVSPMNFAIVYVGLGEKDKAFEYLDRALARHYPELATFNTSPLMDPIRSDARFSQLMRRVGVPPALDAR